MNTFLDYLVVLTAAALLMGPALYGAARERRLDRQIRAAERQPSTPRTGTRTRTRRERTRPHASRVAVRHAPGR
ncbi:hypothetical protein ACIQV3_13375 [Streptomyces sp. NPDC099050]|uniref:hypothetical protein n=1 Tax=Streptomyces sp. NPDC099050 TaxID=3366100 RepID=UPI0038049A9E